MSRPGQRTRPSPESGGLGSQSEIDLDILPVDRSPVNRSLPQTEPREPIDIKSYQLPALNYKPFFLQTWVLAATIIINLSWISWLVVAYCSASITGSSFILGGLFSGYVATTTKFFITAQIMAMGRIMPYRNMLSASRTTANVKNTIDSDYWPYEWPVVRFRASWNGDFFFQFVDIVTFLFTYAVVQFESNILSQGNFGYYPNPGVIIITIICHGVVTITTIAILVWMDKKDTGLLADPGCLSLYLTLLDQEDTREDFRDIEAENRRWIVRERLKDSNYRIGYWRKGNQAIYGIRKSKIMSCPDLVSENKPPYNRTPTKYPEFQYVPWFLATFWVIVWTSILAASLAIIATLAIHDDIVTNGFAPHAPTDIIAFVEISPASFVWSFFPSFAAELFVLLIQSIDTFYRLVQPYVDLKRKDPEPDAIIQAFRINYTNDLPFIVGIRAFLNKHYSVAFISSFSFVASFLPALAANMFWIEGDRVVVQPSYFYTVLGYICFFIVFLLWSVPDRSRYMPRDLETIADHMALFSQSSLLDDGKFQIGEEIRPVVSSAKSESVWIQFQGLLSSLRKSLQTIKHDGWWKSYLRIQKAVIGPPELVDRVVERLEAQARSVHENKILSSKLPRFGTWENGDSYLVGIDCNEDEKMLSLFEESFYKIHWDDILKTLGEQIC
jgi:hypothetical protein